MRHPRAILGDALHGQMAGNRRASVHLRIEFQPTAVHLNQRLRQDQTHPRAGPTAPTSRAPVEGWTSHETLLFIGWNFYAVILNSSQQFLYMSLGRELDEPGVVSKAESVGQQVEESLPQTAFIALKGSNGFGTSKGEGEAPRLSLLAP